MFEYRAFLANTIVPFITLKIAQNVAVNENYAPYGEVCGASGTMSSPFAFTGEAVDANGLQYHRARYYAPETGVWASQDMLETPNRYGYVEGNPVMDAVGEPIFHNRYSYANSNPINRTDPSGLCPPLVNPLGDQYEADARSCHQMVNNLRANLNINITWQENSLPPLTCVSGLIQRVADQRQDVNQRWTTNEVRAIYNAFLIFDKAHTTFQSFAQSAPQYDVSFPYDYIWPRQQPIRFEKKRYISESDQESFGIHFYNDNKITLSALRWGEANSNMTLQSRSWLTLHEFSHFFIKDRIRQRQPDAYLFALDLLANTAFEQYGGRGSATQYSTPGAPGRAEPSFNEEYLVEAVSGTLWNYGYDSVVGYDSGAGGWTGAIGQPTVITVNNLDFTLRNVRNIRGLERFVLSNIIAPPTSS